MDIDTVIGVVLVVALAVMVVCGMRMAYMMGYYAAVREYLDNIDRQKTKNWYKIVERWKKESEAEHGNHQE